MKMKWKTIISPKSVLLGLLLAALVMAVPVSATSGVNVSVTLTSYDKITVSNDVGNVSEKWIIQEQEKLQSMTQSRLIKEYNSVKTNKNINVDENELYEISHKFVSSNETRKFMESLMDRDHSIVGYGVDYEG